VEAPERGALRIVSASEHSTVAKGATITVPATRVLRWGCKVVTFPDAPDLREKKPSDATGHIFVLWPRFPAMLRSRLIGYVWDPSLPVGTVVKSRKTGTVTFLVARSGPERRGHWVGDERNVAEDYRRIYGEDPEDPKGLAL